MSDTARRLHSGKLSFDDYFAQLDPDRKLAGDVKLLNAVFGTRRSITAREGQALGCAAAGFSIAATARALGVSWHTAHRHRINAVDKLEARNITHAVAIYCRAALA